MAVYVEVTIDDGEMVHRFRLPAPADWPEVPRVGDMFAARKGEPGFSSEVTKVSWHVDGDVTVGLGVIEHTGAAGDLPLDGWSLIGEPTRKARR